MTSLPENPYLDEVFAGVYDVQWPPPEAGEVDIPLLLDYAAAQGGPVLELACGTGRVVLPLARAGHLVTGIDSSPQMLAQARAKLAPEPEEVRQRVTLVHGDMRDFHRELLYLLEQCGFRVVERFGGWDREPFNEKAQRQILVAAKIG